MIASKENARIALSRLNGEEATMRPEAFAEIKSFLEAVEKRLPTNAAIEKDRNRSRTPRVSP